VNERTLNEDSIYYRLEYARIARLLEKRTKPHDESRHARSEVPDDGEEVRPALRLSLTAAAEKTIDAITAELTPEQRAIGESPRGLREDAFELAVKAGRELGRLRWHWVGRRPAWYLRWSGLRRWKRRREYLLLAKFLDRVLEPAAVILYFSCLIEEDFVDEPDGILARRLPTDWPLRRPFLQQQADFSPEPFPWLWDYLWYLVSQAQLPVGPRTSTEPDRSWLSQALSQLERSARWLFGWLGETWLRSPAELNYRVRYNLACLFSRASLRASDPDAFLFSAEAQLRLALQALSGPRRAALAEWAWSDPALNALRAAEGYGLERIVPPAARRSRT
jgi:hypothetical protein